MPIWGWICIGLVVAFVVLEYLAGVSNRQWKEHYEQHGAKSVGWIVQANPVLYTPVAVDSAAQILINFDAESDSLDPFMADLAVRAAALKGQSPTDPVHAAVADLVTDETYRPAKRYLLPAEFTGGRKVYSIHIWIRRENLVDGVLQHPFVRCLVLRNEPNTAPRMCPYKPEDETHKLEAR